MPATRKVLLRLSSRSERDIQSPSVGRHEVFQFVPFNLIIVSVKSALLLLEN